MRYATIALLLLAGCDAFEKTEMVPIEKVPENVMKTAQEKLPDVKFDTAWKEGDAYEVRGKTKDGKVRDVKVSPDGKVLEVD